MNDPLIPEPPDASPDVATVADDYRKQIEPKKQSKAPKFLGVDPKRLSELTEQACVRIDDCMTDMGIHLGTSKADVFSMMWDRQTARDMFSGNMGARAALIRGIFQENNWTLNVCQRICRMLAAQHSGDLVGSDPFCAVMPEKSDDPAERKLSKQVEKLVQDEISDSNTRQILAESIRVALIEGERPHKVTWDVDKTQFIGDAVVMVYPSKQAEQEGEDPQSKPEPVKTESGQYIFQKDEFLRFYVNEQGNPVALVKTTPPDLSTGAPAYDAPQQPPDATGIQLRLKKEPSFVMDESFAGPDGKPVYALCKNLVQTLVHHEGLTVAGLFPEDFIYPIRCTSLRDESCDIMAHRYDMPLELVKAKFKGAGFADDYLQLRETGPMSQQNDPDYKMGESIQSDSRKLVNLFETYYRVRVNEDDEFESWAFIVIDFIQRIPVYAEFLGNMKMKRPPFGFIRGVMSEPGRAYGVGVYKQFADKNLAIDVWFNRAALKSSKTASITFQHENGIKAEYQGQKLVIGGTEVYKIPASASENFGPDHPPVFRVNLNEMTDKEFELMDKLIQDGDLSFGVVNAAPEVSAGLSNKGEGTATAVRNVERTGNILQRATEELMASDIEELLELMTDTILENQDEESLQWTPDEDEIAVLNRDEIRNLPRDVRVLLTRAKGDEAFQINDQASQKTQEFMALSAAIRKKVYPMYRQILKSLFIIDADEIIEEPTDEEIQAEQQQASKPPSETMAYKDTPPSIQRQMEAAAGFKPATDEEQMQHEANKAAIKSSSAAPSNVTPMPQPSEQTQAQPLAQPPQ